MFKTQILDIETKFGVLLLFQGYYLSSTPCSVLQD